MIDFQWTISSPDPAIVNDFYAARWSGTIRSPKSGAFKIGLQGNDGFRLYIDDKLVIERWVKQSYHADVVDFTFEKDRAYRLRVEFFEPVGNGQIKLIWNMPVNEDSNKGIEEAVAVCQESRCCRDRSGHSRGRISGSRVVVVARTSGSVDSTNCGNRKASGCGFSWRQCDHDE